MKCLLEWTKLDIRREDIASQINYLRSPTEVQQDVLAITGH